MIRAQPIARDDWRLSGRRPVIVGTAYDKAGLSFTDANRGVAPSGSGRACVHAHARLIGAPWVSGVDGCCAASFA
jgi:hypothetical protein